MKRKILALVLVLLLLPVVPAGAADTAYIVSAAAGAKVYAEPTDTSAVLTVAKYQTVLTSDSSESSFLRVRYDGYVGWVSAADVSLYGVSLRLESIAVTSLPDKTVYYEDDPFSAEGLVVTAYYSDGTAADVRGYTLVVPDMYSVGEKTVTVSYQGQSTSFSITVNRQPIDYIEISTPPAELTVPEGTEAPQFEGLELTVYYTDGRAPMTTTDYTLLNYDPDTLGEQTVLVSYKYEDITAPLTIEVVPKTLLSLTVTTEPTKQIYYDDDLRIDLSGLVLSATYDNGKTETVEPDSAQFAPYSVLNTDVDILLSYGGMTASYTVRLNRTEAVGISVSPPNRTTCLLNAEPDFSGLVVYLEYNSGNREGITDYQVDTVDTSSYGTKTVNVYYESFSASFEIQVVSDAMRGDVNKDGSVTSLDARLALRGALSLAALTEEQQWLGDANGDGTVTTADARRILRAAVNLEELEAV